METFHNKNEHNHADKEAWSDEALEQEAKKLAEQLKAPWITDERRLDLQRQMAKVAFEQYSRYQERL